MDQGLKCAPTPSLLLREGILEDWLQIVPWATFSRDPKALLRVGVAEEATIRAYMQWYSHPRHATTLVISRLEVHPQFRRNGSGCQFVSSLQMLSSICRIVASEVQWDAVPFWEYMGFVPYGPRPKQSDMDAGHWIWSRQYFIG